MSFRIAVIGQSNSILQQGYLNKLRPMADVALGRMGRLGASPSLLLPYYANEAFFADHDFAIFDLCVGDQAFLWSGAVDLHAIGRWLEQAIVAAHRTGCLPIILAIPHQSMVPAPQPLIVPPLQQLYRSIALRMGALCCDLLEPIARRLVASPDNAIDIYADPDHLTERWSQLVAERLVVLMKEAAGASIPRRPEVALQPRFDRLPVAALAGIPAIRRESALLSGEFVVLKGAKRWTLPTGPVRRVSGCLINRIGSRGQFGIAGDQALIKPVGTARGSDGEFVAQLVPFLGEVQDRDGKLGLAAIPPNIVPTEPAFGAQPATESRIEISELIVERAARVVDYAQPNLPAALRRTDWIDGRPDSPPAPAVTS